MAWWTPLVAVAVTLVAFAVLARRFPVLFRMGLRNIGRRKTQAAVVVAGLMVGTAIITGSFATADSLSYGITKGVYDGLGPVDQTVQIEGGLLFPEAAYIALRDNATLQERVHGMAPYLLQEAAIKNLRTRQAEPRVSIIGFDAAAEQRFEPFVTTTGAQTYGDELRENEVYVTEELARALGTQEGDTVRLSYRPIPTILLPKIHNFSGTLTGSNLCTPPGPPGLPPVPCADVPGQQPAEVPGQVNFTFPVQRAAQRIIAVVLPDFVNRTSQNPPPDFDLRVTNPGGASWENRNGTQAQPDRPTILNVTTGERLDKGNWTLTVSSKGSAQEPFKATVLVFYEVYSLAELQNFTAELEKLSGRAREEFDIDEAGLTGGGNPLQKEFTVRAIVTPQGKGDFLLRQNVFIPLKAAQAMYGREGYINAIGITNTGATEGGLSRTAEVSDAVNASLRALAASDPDEPSYSELKVVALKDRFLNTAERAGDLFKQFLTTIGSFTVIAGVMLIINIFVMLAEERKSELGMARAVGLKRRQLVALFSFEGLIYALAAAVVGVLLGLLIAAGLLWGFNNILANAGDDGPRITEFPFHPELESLAWAFTAGFFITLLTVAFASYKVSKLNVVRAIRRQEEPDKPADRRTTIIGSTLLATALLLALLGVAYDIFGLKVFMPALGLMGLGMILTRWSPRRIAYPVTGAAVAVYIGWALLAIEQPPDNVSRVLGVLQGVLLVLAVVLIVIYLPVLTKLTQEALTHVRRLRGTVRPAIAYPMEKKTRTGLTVSMFSLVILVVVVFSTFGATFNVDLQEQTGGYDVEAETTIPISDLRSYYENNVTDKPPGRNPFDAVARYESLTYANGQNRDSVRIDGKPVDPHGPHLFYSYDRGFADASQYTFESLLPEYGSPQAALHAVLNDSTLVIISTPYNFDEAGQPGAHQPGATMVMETAGGNVTFTVIGIMKQQYLGGIWVHPSVLNANFQRIRGEYLFKLNPGEDPAQVAMELEAAFETAGMNAVSLPEAAAKAMERNRQFLTLFQLFLAFGLVVGIASMGIITARSVIERRQEIGMLRAVGYRKSHIMKIFVTEILFTTILGMLIGVAVGIFIAWTVYHTTMRGLGVDFTVPFGEIASILAATALVTLLATYLPARQASRIPPAEAVRYIE